MNTNKNYKILIAEDEESLAMLIDYNLIKNGYQTNIVKDGELVLSECQSFNPDLILLDWMLPNISGIELCRRLRTQKKYNNVPIVMITAMGEENDKIRGLETGADDYITKPFSFPELIARIQAVLRRSMLSKGDNVVKVGDISVNREEYKVTRDEYSISLGPTEFKLLNCLIEHPGMVFSREKLLDNVWGIDNINVEIRTVDVHIGRLRKALNIEGKEDPIRTVRSAGYSIEKNF
ncbi:MAG: phosphate regulon transcriptional regulator PhoB [Alphaproteobacteria bacterium]|nr:MAG: phosphate regulon transcriptional regulatory protein PhoB [alpha proteobacterium MED-G09]|tara:strand:- start:156 stop:860 length:705 start_codon:yes stop_codon:yes gene_type:complete